ncbi:hypothetical protein, partial [Stenotrophomonas sp. Betaine-02u-23]|uniref:hypothetical protein n=3 Tax=unclassified Stenotrophomonas TaxID=196198 RepID=UPI000C336E66
PTGFNNVGTIAAGSLRACQLPTSIVGNLVIKKLDGVAYAINGQVSVGQDTGGNAAAPAAGAQTGTLTVEPGTTFFGSAGADFIVVNRGSQIFAEGTATAPIVFTSRLALEGQNNIDSIGQWGGIVILGRAAISACPGTTVSGTPECQALIEGVNNAFYGGNKADDNSGRLRYVRVMHSGYAIAPNNELQGITLGGVGSGTTLDHLQVYNSSDDGIEIFGGSANLRHLVLNGNDDDALDTDTGWNGGAQFGIVIQRANGGDRMTEFSAIRRTPYSTPKIANFTFVGRAGGTSALELNQGTQASFYNSVVTRTAGGTGAAAQCLNIVDDNTTGTFQSVYFSCPTPFVAGSRAETAFSAGANNTATGTSTLTGTFINGANETAVTPFANLSGVHAFFQNVDYIGAVKNTTDTWYQGWTCGLTADKPC